MYSSPFCFASLILVFVSDLLAYICHYNWFNMECLPLFDTFMSKFVINYVYFVLSFLRSSQT